MVKHIAFALSVCSTQLENSYVPSVIVSILNPREALCGPIVISAIEIEKDSCGLWQPFRAIKLPQVQAIDLKKLILLCNIFTFIL